MARVPSRLLPAALLALALAALLAGSAPGARAEDAPADWRPVADVLGVAGRTLPDGTWRVDVPRKDPALSNEWGFPVPASMVLTYAAFRGTPGDATVLGDTCLLGEEVNPVIDALRAGGIEVVAVHNHMLGGTPNFVFVHFQGHGRATALAAPIRKAWDLMGKPHPLPPRERRGPPKTDWKAVSEAIGRPGSLQEDGVYKVVLPRARLGTTLDGKPIPPGAVPACWAGFAPCDCGLTMVMGDTCLLRSELQAAIDGYRRHGLRIVAIHNHVLGTSPELIFCHFSGEGDAVELAKAVKTVWSPLAETR
jgi:hypothetical protein